MAILWIFPYLGPWKLTCNKLSAIAGEVANTCNLADGLLFVAHVPDDSPYVYMHLYIYIYVCVYKHIYIYTRVYIYINTYAFMCASYSDADLYTRIRIHLLATA